MRDELKRIHTVDLLVRSWIERLNIANSLLPYICRPPCEVVNWKISGTVGVQSEKGRPPCEVVNWKISENLKEITEKMSTSLWGRELKGHVDDLRDLQDRRPPCEVVNWKVLPMEVLMDHYCRPPCEVVNWKKRSHVGFGHHSCRPPCEVVNWKVVQDFRDMGLLVDLLVRSWIESTRVSRTYSSSGSRPPCEVVNWKTPWVTGAGSNTSRPPCEVVNWKNAGNKITRVSICRPPCEVVNWKVTSSTKISPDMMSTSLWGRELKGFNSVEYTGNWSRPPCEVQLRKRYS